MSKLNDLEKAKYAAEAEYNQLRREVDSEASEAARAAKAIVEAKYEKRLGELRKAERAAQTAWQDELDASAAHEWEGKKVSCERNVGRSWSPKLKTIFGVVEVRRSDTQLPTNIYPPAMGSAFVRLLNKDGSVGKRIDTWGGIGSRWKLVASGTEAGTAETEGLSPEGDGPMAKPDAQNQSGDNS